MALEPGRHRARAPRTARWPLRPPRHAATRHRRSHRPPPQGLTPDRPQPWRTPAGPSRGPGHTHRQRTVRHLRGEGGTVDLGVVAAVDREDLELGEGAEPSGGLVAVRQGRQLVLDPPVLPTDGRRQLDADHRRDGFGRCPRSRDPEMPRCVDCCMGESFRGGRDAAPPRPWGRGGEAGLLHALPTGR